MTSRTRISPGRRFSPTVLARAATPLLISLLAATGCSSVARVAFVPSTGIAASDREAASKRIEPPPDRSLIYVYRPGRMTGSAVRLLVVLDGKPTGSLVNDTYFVFDVAPGEHTIVAGSLTCFVPENFGSRGALGTSCPDSSRSTFNPQQPITIQTSPGRAYFISLNLEFTWTGPPGAELEQVSSEVGSKAIQEYTQAIPVYDTLPIHEPLVPR
jgi:hypothetical protein